MGRVSPDLGVRIGRAPGRTWFRRRAKRASSRTAAWSRSARRARCAAATQPRLPGPRAKNPERAAKAKAIRNVHRHRSPAASPASRTLRRCATSTTETPHPTALPPVYAASPTRKYRWRNARRARNAWNDDVRMGVDGSVQILRQGPPAGRQSLGVTPRPPDFPPSTPRFPGQAHRRSFPHKQRAVGRCGRSAACPARTGSREILGPSTPPASALPAPLPACRPATPSPKSHETT